MEAAQDLKAWHNLYTQDDSNRFFKESDFVVIDEPKPKPRRQIRSLDDDWEA